MKKILLTVVAALMLVLGSVPAKAQCYFCYTYPNPLPGFVMVASSYAVQDGEFMMCDSSGAWCQKTGMGSGGFYNISQLGDWGSQGNWYVYSIKSRMHRQITFHLNTNFTGSTWSYNSGGALYSLTNIPGFFGKMNSINLQN